MSACLYESVEDPVRKSSLEHPTWGTQLYFLPHALPTRLQGVCVTSSPPPALPAALSPPPPPPAKGLTRLQRELNQHCRRKSLGGRSEKEKIGLRGGRVGRRPELGCRGICRQVGGWAGERSVVSDWEGAAAAQWCPGSSRGCSPGRKALSATWTSAGARPQGSSRLV